LEIPLKQSKQWLVSVERSGAAWVLVSSYFFPIFGPSFISWVVCPFSRVGAGEQGAWLSDTVILRFTFSLQPIWPVDGVCCLGVAFWYASGPMAEIEIRGRL
jgi:hypothetical protein